MVMGTQVTQSIQMRRHREHTKHTLKIFLLRHSFSTHKVFFVFIETLIDRKLVFTEIVIGRTPIISKIVGMSLCPLITSLSVRCTDLLKKNNQ